MTAQPSRKRSRYLGPALSAGFGAAAVALGYGGLSPYASAAGGWLGQKIKDITGFGDYTVNKNSLLSGTVPSVGNSSSHPDGLTISHREYLGDVITSSTAKEFRISDYNLNPSDPQTWEWLSQIACNYEEWVPEGILFYYKSTSGEAFTSTDASMGTVIMATNYNPYNKAFTTKAEMSSYEFCTSGPPNSDLIHMIECDPHEGAISTYFMSSVNSSGSEGLMDKRFNTLGTFYIATTGFQGTSCNIGELWVTYQVTLLKPKLYESLGLAVDSIRTEMYPYGTATQGSGVYGLWPQTQGTNQARTADLTMPYTAQVPSDALWIDNNSNNVRIHWPVYAFETYYYILLGILSAGLVGPTYTVTHNVGTGLKPPVTNAGPAQSPEVGDVSDYHTFRMEVRVPGGFVCNDPANTPYTSISVAAGITGNFSWKIIQIPAVPNGLYSIDPPL
ncbi:capsid protein [Crucivirus-265]|nr:capsid protein [Crucivirus-265]